MSWGTFGFILQLCFVYWFSAVHKSHAQWRSEFTAVHYALHIDSYATAFGMWLREFRGLTRGMTIGVLGFELAGPFLIFGAGLLSLVPGLHRLAAFQPTLRILGVLGFMGLHAGLGLGLSLGTFSWFALLIWLAVLPGEFWDYVERLRIKMGSRWVWLARLTPPTWAANPEVFSPWQRRLRAASGGAAFLSLMCVSLLNLRTVNAQRFGPYLDGRATSLLPRLDYALNFLRLDQHWGLFAPYPRTRDGWFVLEGIQENGAQANLLRPEAPLVWEPPTQVSATYETFRWRKYYRDLRRDGAVYKRQRPYYLAYYCAAWNAEHTEPERVRSLQLFYMERRTKRDGGYSQPMKILLASAPCQRSG